MSAESTTIYTSGHHESVLRSHNWRTAANSASYLLSSLRPWMKILDIGCGPGTITADFAELVPDGDVVGVDTESDVLEQVQVNANTRGLRNITIEIGSIHSLKYPDNTFDVVHTHQVLQHCGEPIKAIVEMRRVLKPGGLLAAREADMSVNQWYPEYAVLDQWLSMYMRVARANGGDPMAGRKIHAWAHQAGFERGRIDVTTSTWCFRSQEDRSWWGQMWADRLIQSAFFQQAIDGGHATPDQLHRMSQAWKRWCTEPDGLFVMVHGEILCRK